MNCAPFSICLAISILAGGPMAFAHVPYLETRDFAPLAPFVSGDAAQSIAVYSWLESVEDIDFFVTFVSEPTAFYVELLVPVCPDYETFFPQFALIGPNLPGPSMPVGVGGYRIHFAPWIDREEPRETFYEPFGGKSYYEGPAYDELVVQPGLYILAVWDVEGAGGDYVLGIGKEERWPLPDLIRALVNTPIIRRNEELHGPCGSQVQGTKVASP